MAIKIFNILATSMALCAVVYIGPDLAMARGGGGGVGAHVGGGGGRGGGGVAHFSGGGARFSGAPSRGFSSSRIGMSRSNFARINGAHIRGLSASRIGMSRSNFARISGANVRGLSGGRALAARTAWNRWGNHTWRTGWHGGWGGWGGPVFWPYFYGNLFAFAFWPYGYYDPFWAYGDIFVWDAMLWPGPDYAYGGMSPFDIYGEPYAYGGPARTRAARSRNVDREITGTTTNNDDLAQTCGGLAPGVTDLPVDYIQEKIQPTDEQLKALDALKKASSQASDALKASCSSEILLTPLGRLDTAQKRLDSMIQALGIVRTPLDNFYNSLSDEQKQRFAELGPASDARKSRRGSPSANDLPALCSRRTESFTQVPVDRIEKIVKPTREQQDAFARLKIVSADAANRLQASCPTQTPQTLTDRFDALAKRLDAMAAAIKTVRPELANFYGSLTDEQKARFNTLGPPPTTGSRQG
jgi:hypothetical protein